VCVSSARTGLCGGQRVTAVPTATALDESKSGIKRSFAVRQPRNGSRTIDGFTRPRGEANPLLQIQTQALHIFHYAFFA